MIENVTEPQHEKKSISEARLRANRENSLKSTGPKTPEGKRRACLNAQRSRIHSQIDCLPAEDLAVYHKLLDEVIAEYNPVGPTERFHAAAAAQSMWRLQRAAALEQGIFANGHRERIDSIDTGHQEVDSSLVAAQTFVEQAKAITLLSTYETRIRRSLEKDLAALRVLQAERKEAYERAADQATIFAKYAASRDELYDPGDDFKPASAWGGFVFSEPELRRRWARKCRYEDALYYHNHGRDPHPEPENDPQIDMAA